VVPNKGAPAAGSVPLSAMKVLKEHRLTPADTFSIGDSVAVINGPDRNTKGDVVSECGIASVNIKTAKDDSMEVQKEDLALFSAAWEKAAVGLRGAAESDVESMMDVDEVSRRVAAAPPTPEGEMMAEDTPEWARGGAIVTPVSQVGVETPAQVDTPMTVASNTPLVTPQSVSDGTPQAAMTVDSPSTVKGETPETNWTDASSSASAFSGTPNASPAAPLNAMQLRLRARLSRLPVATTPMLPGHVTPASPAYGHSPTPSGTFTPMPGGVTPMLPVPGGNVTPIPGRPGGETPLTPLSRGVTPLGVAAVPGPLTPMPGVTTPDLKKVGGTPTTPAMGQGGTPAASSTGGATPKSDIDADKA